MNDQYIDFSHAKNRLNTWYKDSAPDGFTEDELNHLKDLRGQVNPKNYRNFTAAARTLAGRHAHAYIGQNEFASDPKSKISVVSDSEVILSVIGNKPTPLNKKRLNAVLVNELSDAYTGFLFRAFDAKVARDIRSERKFLAAARLIEIRLRTAKEPTFLKKNTDNDYKEVIKRRITNLREGLINGKIYPDYNSPDPIKSIHDNIGKARTTLRMFGVKNIPSQSQACLAVFNTIVTDPVSNRQYFDSGSRASLNALAKDAGVDKSQVDNRVRFSASNILQARDRLISPSTFIAVGRMSDPIVEGRQLVENTIKYLEEAQKATPQEFARLSVIIPSRESMLNTIFGDIAVFRFSGYILDHFEDMVKLGIEGKIGDKAEVRRRIRSVFIEDSGKVRDFLIVRLASLRDSLYYIAGTSSMTANEIEKHIDADIGYVRQAKELFGSIPDSDHPSKEKILRTTFDKILADSDNNLMDEAELIKLGIKSGLSEKEALEKIKSAVNERVKSVFTEIGYLRTYDDVMTLVNKKEKDLEELKKKYPKSFTQPIPTGREILRRIFDYIGSDKEITASSCPILNDKTVIDRLALELNILSGDHKIFEKVKK